MKRQMQTFGLLLLGAAALIACTASKPLVLQETKTQVIAPPASLVSVVEVPKPDFTPQEYSVFSADKKEAALTDLNSQLYLALAKANATLVSISEWVEKQTTLYKKE